MTDLERLPDYSKWPTDALEDAHHKNQEIFRLNAKIERLNAALLRVRPCLFKEHRDIVDAALKE
jgi:hypothetical protein